MKARQGMAELGKPGYDKRLWDDSDSWLKAPTLREVTEIALEVIGSATGQQWWLGYVDDALFAGMDLGGGYKTVEQIGNELGKKALTQAVNMGVGNVTKWAGNAAGTALSKSGKAANIFAQAGISAAGSYAGSVANNYVNALDLSKLGTKEWMDWEAGNAGWTSAGSVSGALSAGIGSGMGSAFGTMGAATNKFYGGAMSLATSAATQAATYGTYVAFNGGNFGAAYEAMGGITLNVANLGAMVDMVGTGIARTNSTGQSRLGSIARKLSNTGLLEVNIGSNGVTGRIGMGGIDVGGNLYNLAKRMTDKASLEAYKAEYGEDKGNTAYNAYVYGDWTQENTAARLASEIDQLVFSDGSGKSEGWNAQTTRNGSGGRTIEMLNSGNDYNNAITLGHEAYRDGVIGNNQKAETLAATFGHTGMAVRMLQDGANVGITENLAKDINAYLGGNMDDFLKYVDGNYDSSADYWKLQMHADGSHELIFDGKKELSIDYLDENGGVISTATPGRQDMSDIGMAGSLTRVLGLERAEDLMGSSYLNVDNYDFQTLRDILPVDKYSDSEIVTIQRKGTLEGIALSENQIQSLVGESLMKTSGANYEAGKGWQNTGSISTTITNGLISGNLMAEVNNGKYLYSTVNATVFRDPNSWKSFESNGDITIKNNGLDTITYTKTGINHDYSEVLILDKYQTVDNLNKKNQDQPYYDFTLGSWIQGNTVLSSSFNMGYLGTSGSFAQDVLVINNATTIANDIIGKFGGLNNSDSNRWLAHDNSTYKEKTNSYELTKYLWSDGCFVTTSANQKLLLQQLQSWNVSNGYQIKTYLNEKSYSKTPYGGR